MKKKLSRSKVKRNPREEWKKIHVLVDKALKQHNKYANNVALQVARSPDFNSTFSAFKRASLDARNLREELVKLKIPRRQAARLANIVVVDFRNHWGPD